MNRAERRRLEREQKKQEKTAIPMNPLEQWHGEREIYIVGLAKEAIERTTGPQSIPLAEAIERASSGEGPFWSFDPEWRGGKVVGGHTLVVEHYEDGDQDGDPKDRWTWIIWIEGNRFAEEEIGMEDSVGPGDDLSEYEHMRFLPVQGERPIGTMLSFSLAQLLGRPREEVDDHL